MPPRATKRRRAEDGGARGDDDDADVEGAAARESARDGRTSARRADRAASERSASFALTARRPSARPSAVRGLFEAAAEEDGDGSNSAKSKPPPESTLGDADADADADADDGKRGKRAKTTVAGGAKRRGRSGSRSKGETTDEDDDPLDAFMAANDDAMDQEREKAKERAKREAEEKEAAKLEAKAKAEATPMEVSEEDALMRVFAAAAKKAAAAGKIGARGASADGASTSKPLVLGVKKSVVEVLRPVIPTAAVNYVPVKKNRRTSKRAQVMNEVFDSSGGESSEDEDEIKDEAKTTGLSKDAVEGAVAKAEVDDDDDDDEAWAKKQTAKLSKTERLGTVNHDEIDYEPVKKNFYIEAKEISLMTKAEVKQLRVELDGIKCRGKKVPKPIKTWAQAGLNNRVHELIRRSGFEKPMPIQAQALPVIMSGRDCIGVAKTGSGKTLAYILPMLRHINAQEPLASGDGPIGMIMGPTRELVTQIGKDCKRYGKAMGFSAVSVYGGSGIAAQIGDLKRGAEIVACTPGRMIDLLTTGSGKITNLRRVTYMVLDEADRMFDMGFEPQITRILANLRPDRQTVMFSATFPHTMEALARAALDNPIEIQIGGKSVVNSDIEQLVELRPEEDRFLRVLELLGEWYERGKIIIFVASQDKADSTFKELLKSGYPCLSLHGGKEQSDRQSTISDFKSDVCNILVATSVAARGLDVKDLRLVINYDTPNHLEDYVHRVGRTGRAGQKGTRSNVYFRGRRKVRTRLSQGA